jgi:hypothetical protein
MPETFTMDYRPLPFGITLEFMVKQAEGMFPSHDWLLDLIKSRLSTVLKQFQDIAEFIGSHDIEISVFGTRIKSPGTIAAANPHESFVYRPAVVDIQKISSASVHAFNFVRAICEVLSSNFDVHFDPCCQFRVHVGMCTPEIRYSVSKSKIAKLIALLWTIEPELSAIQEETKATNEASHLGGEPSRADPLRMSMREYTPLSKFQRTDYAGKKWIKDVFYQKSFAPLSDDQRLEIVSIAPSVKHLYALVTPHRGVDDLLESRVPSIDWSQLLNYGDQVISFGHHGPTLDPDLMTNWIKLCVQLVKYAVGNRSISIVVRQCQQHLSIKANVRTLARSCLAYGHIPTQDVVDRCVRKIVLDRFLRQISLCEQAEFYWDRLRNHLPMPPYLHRFRPGKTPLQVKGNVTRKDDTTSNAATDNANNATMDYATMDYATMDNATIGNATTHDATTHDATTHDATTHNVATYTDATNNTTASITDNMDDMFDWLDDESFNFVVDNFYG